jgi:serine/threonine protein phosphatase PrpC
MKTSQDACAELVRQALGGGGRDNITVIVGGYTLPDEAAQEAAESA